MNSRSKGRLDNPAASLRALKRELEGVEQFLYQLRHNRGRWPKKWVTGMLRYYEDREAALRDRISRRNRRRRRREL